MARIVRSSAGARCRRCRFINDYHDDDAYIDALGRQIAGIGTQLGERSHLLFSYHGIPVSYVEKGDPYQRQAEATTRAVVSRLE